MNDKCGLERYQLILWGLLSQPTFVSYFNLFWRTIIIIHFFYLLVRQGLFIISYYHPLIFIILRDFYLYENQWRIYYFLSISHEEIFNFNKISG